MSSDLNNTTSDTSFPPQHRLHNPDEPLPGSEGGRDTDRSPYASPEERSSSGQPCDPSNTTGDTSFFPQHRLRNPDESLPGSEGRRDTDCSPYAAPEEQSSSGKPCDPSNTTGDTSFPPQHRLHNPDESLPGSEGGRDRDTDRSPHISYASEERSSSGQPCAIEANGYGASDGPIREQSGRGAFPGIGRTPPARDTDPDAAIPGAFNTDSQSGRGAVPGIGSTPPARDTDPGVVIPGAFNTERPLGAAPVPEGQYRSCQAVSLPY